MSNQGTRYDAIVVGSGPNGLAAAITMQQKGLSVLLLEEKATTGGGMRSEEFTLPGFIHDVCSAVHPMAIESPFFSSLPLEELGVSFIYPPICAAHPLDDGSAAVLETSVTLTAHRLGADAQAYRSLMEPVLLTWPSIAGSVFGPLHLTSHPIGMARFGLRSLQSAERVIRNFKDPMARGLFAGMAGHSMLPLHFAATAGFGLVLLTAGHRAGWPIAAGGSQSIAAALTTHFQRLGGTVETNRHVQSVDDLPRARTVLLDVTPRQALNMAGHKFSAFYKRQLNRFRYGMGVFKIDWALDGPVPFTAPECRKAGTVHLGGTYEEIAASERATWEGIPAVRPFVLLSQPSLFDPSRAPAGKQTVWAYCHVPYGSTADMTDAIEKQVERFAPGFKDLILARHVINADQLHTYNSNYVGGDINGGALNLGQFFTRPALRISPYRTSARDVYLCSSSTPPGAGVHGMCGYHAALRAIKDHF